MSSKSAYLWLWIVIALLLLDTATVGNTSYSVVVSDNQHSRLWIAKFFKGDIFRDSFFTTEKKLANPALLVPGGTLCIIWQGYIDESIEKGERCHQVFGFY